MKTFKLVLLALTGILLPTSLSAQEEAKRDTTSSNKEVKNRNVLLNASNADQPRQISIGLPSSLSASIFEDGLPVSYATWPDMPYFSWFGGVSQSKIALMSISETALQYGAVGYTVDSYNRHAGKEFQGIVNYQLNQFGRQKFDANLSGPIKRGWGYTVSSHQIIDPGSYKLDAANNQTRAQVYKFGLNKLLNNNRGNISLLYQFSRYTNNASDSGPFIFVGDGSTKKFNGFNLGTDPYYPIDGTQMTYMDVMDGKQKTRSWKDLGTTDNHQLTFNFNYHWDNGTQLAVSSKLKDGDVNITNITVSGIVDNNETTPYFLKDGSVYRGEKIQNRYIMYDKGFERDWLTTAVLTGMSKNRNHAWRLGTNFWFNQAGIQANHFVTAHEAQKNPQSLYIKDADGLLQNSWSYNTGGEYYDGHERKIALYASDDWTISRKLWMSLGVRLEYYGINGKGALNLPDADGNATHYNDRGLNWSLANEGTRINKFSKNYLNPSATFNVRYNILPRFGLVGEYVYVRQRPKLEDYAGSEMPDTKPININMARAGLFWNTNWMQLVSQVSLIGQTANKSRSQFYWIVNGKEENQTVPIIYDIQTMGWTTDVVLTPFKGFMFHGLLTLQNPIYKNFNLKANFSDGEHSLNISDNVVTAMSKCLIELDPSYSFDKWNIWLSFRYQSKQYINKSNSLYFNGHWETFGGVNYTLNKHVNFALNVVNILNQKGANGSIGAADLITDPAPYKNYVMAGSYIRPFEIGLSTTINF